MMEPHSFDDALNTEEQRIFSVLNSPYKIQDFLDGVPYSTEPIYRCPLRVLRDRRAHCFDGALFAAAALRRIGYPPLILDMIPNGRDDDHLLALFKRSGYWGAVAKSNFSGLRFREPIFRTLRELVLSYFEQYFNIEGEKTLRGYSAPLNLAAFDQFHWTTSDDCMDAIADRLDKIRKFSLLSQEMVAGLSPVDKRTFEAGLQGADEAGLHRLT
jgi:hypothetical protein